MSRQERGERPQCQLEAIGLGLVAAQEKDRPAGGWRALGRREVFDVHGVRKHLPRSPRHAEEEIGRALRELALVENVVGGEKGAAERSVDRLGAISRPARIADAVLVHDDGNPATPRQVKQRTQIAWQPGRAEVEQREVARAVRKPLVQLLRLRRSARGPLAGRRNEVVAVEDADARVRRAAGRAAASSVRPPACSARSARCSRPSAHPPCRACATKPSKSSRQRGRSAS